MSEKETIKKLGEILKEYKAKTTKKEIMTEQEKIEKLGKVLEEGQGFIIEKIGGGLDRITSTKIYKSRNNTYKTECKRICPQLTELQFERLEDALSSVYNLDVTYSYVKGIIDGIQLSECITSK